MFPPKPSVRIKIEKKTQSVMHSTTTTRTITIVLILLYMALLIVCSQQVQKQQQKPSTTKEETKEPTIERCALSGPCTRCTKEQKSDMKQICQETGYHQMVICIVSGTSTNRTILQSCTPEIIYTDYSTRNFMLFEAAMLIVFLLVGIAFYRRKKFLFIEAQNRYERLTSVSTNED
jgi:hypothetical protein